MFRLLEINRKKNGTRVIQRDKPKRPANVKADHPADKQTVNPENAVELNGQKIVANAGLAETGEERDVVDISDTSVDEGDVSEYTPDPIPRKRRLSSDSSGQPQKEQCPVRRRPEREQGQCYQDLNRSSPHTRATKRLAAPVPQSVGDLAPPSRSSALEDPTSHSEAESARSSLDPASSIVVDARAQQEILHDQDAPAESSRSKVVRLKIRKLVREDRGPIPQGCNTESPLETHENASPRMEILVQSTKDRSGTASQWRGRGVSVPAWTSQCQALPTPPTDQWSPTTNNLQTWPPSNVVQGLHVGATVHSDQEGVLGNLYDATPPPDDGPETCISRQCSVSLVEMPSGTAHPPERDVLEDSSGATTNVKAEDPNSTVADPSATESSNAALGTAGVSQDQLSAATNTITPPRDGPTEEPPAVTSRPAVKLGIDYFIQKPGPGIVKWYNGTLRDRSLSDVADVARGLAGWSHIDRFDFTLFTKTNEWGIDWSIPRSDEAEFVRMKKRFQKEMLLSKKANEAADFERFQIDIKPVGRAASAGSEAKDADDGGEDHDLI